MILNEALIDKLDAIHQVESDKISRILHLPANELGNCLIDLFYSTSNPGVRDLIAEFMTEAGAVWLRKLMTKDTDPVESTTTQFASLHDYTNLLGANCDVAELDRTGS